MQAALSLVENLHCNTLHHPGNQVLVQRHSVHPGRLQLENRTHRCRSIDFITAVPVVVRSSRRVVVGTTSCSIKSSSTHMFVEEGSNSGQIWVEGVPHHHLQPADLNLSVQTIKQRRVTVRQTHHHIWGGVQFRYSISINSI